MKKLLFISIAAFFLAGAANAAYVYAGQWGTYGTGPGQFYRPVGIAVAPNGNVYVADFNNHRIQYFTATGSYLGEWGSWGSGPGEFKGPQWVAVARNGTVFVTESSWNSRVQYFTSTGSFLGKWDSWGSGPGQFIYRRRNA
jgi:tripartite motif-containing protein 71